MEDTSDQRGKYYVVIKQKHHITSKSNQRPIISLSIAYIYL